MTFWNFLILFIGLICSQQIFAINQGSYSCQNKHCFVSTNSQQEKILNCTHGNVKDQLVACSYIPTDFKLILTTQSGDYIQIDKIAAGTFKRLVSGLIVQKIFFNKFLVTKLDSVDFDGLIDITEMRLENPKSLKYNTFQTLATKTKFFVLHLSCNEGYKVNSFDEIYLNTNNWALFTNNCDYKQICEHHYCDSDKRYSLSKIISTKEKGKRNYRLSFYSCQTINTCKSNNPLPNVIVTSTQSSVVSSSQKFNTPKPIVKESKLLSDNNDSLMLIVLVLTIINSIVIMGILLFLIIWWKKLATSDASKKHTIILKDETDRKYLKLSPCV